MGKKHFNSKHDDETWKGLFGRWHAGEDACALKREAGVTHDTWRSNARRLEMRIKDLPEGHPGRRRVPAFADRADDYRHPNSKRTEGEWDQAIARRMAGENPRTIAADIGVGVNTLQRQAKARGFLKRDHPEAKAAPRGPGVDPRPPTSPEARAATAFPLDPDDLKKTVAAIEGRMKRAARRGLTEAVEYLARMTPALVRHARAKDVILDGRPRPVGADDVAGRSYTTGQAPPEGEGEAPALPAPTIELRTPQRPPEGDWSTWLFLGGRGAGKTLAGAMWLADMAEALGPEGRLALVGPTLHDVREVMIEGASGILGLGRWHGTGRPVFESSRRRLTFPNGARAWAFSAEDPDSLRGPQFGAAWADEFCAWRNGGETLALLRMGLRLGGDPRLCVTTTPRASVALRTLRGEASCVETHAGTADNAAHLAPGFLEGLRRLYGGTRREAQELEGKVVELDGALFSAEMLARARSHPAGDYRPSGCLSPRTPDDGARGQDGAAGPFDRVVVAIDPTTTREGNPCGIVVAGRAGETAWVLADRSQAGLSPLEWARRAARAAEEFGAKAIVAEVNQGGEMVAAVLKAAGCETEVRAVRAARGKRARAEPVAALYEQGRVRHAGNFRELEEELMAFGGEDEGRVDLDRADALVWAITDLLLERTVTREGPRITVLDAPAGPPGLSGPRVWTGSWGIAGRRESG